MGGGLFPLGVELQGACDVFPLGLPLGLLGAAAAVESGALALLGAAVEVEPEGLAPLGGLPLGLFISCTTVEVE